MRELLITDLPKIGVPAIKALKSIGITKVDHLTKVSEDELRETHGFSPKAIKILAQALEVQGKSFAKSKKK